MAEKCIPLLPLDQFRQRNMDDMSRLPGSNCTKVFVERDYSEGTIIKFHTKYPAALEGKIERNLFENTVKQLNQMYLEAGSLSTHSYCESCFACMTAYLAYLCMETYYEKMMKKIARYIREQNDNIYTQRGLLLIDPIERGLRVVEICIFTASSPR